MKWAVLFFLCSASTVWADPPAHYSEVKAELEDLVATLRSDYEPVMLGPRYQFELRSRQNKIKKFRQVILPQYVSDVFLICERLEERDAQINQEVREDPVTQANGPTAEQKAELAEIYRARALCAAQGAYPENQRIKVYWRKYYSLDRNSLGEYEEVTARLGQCLNISGCWVGQVRHPG